MNCSLALVFNKDDFSEAQRTFINYFEKDNPTGEAPDGIVYDGLEPTLWVDLATVTIPALAGLIGLWLGKGKQVIVERKKGISREKIIIKHHDKQSTIKILRELLNEE